MIKTISNGAVLSYYQLFGLPWRPIYNHYEVVVDVDFQNETITVIRLEGSQSNIGMLGSSKKHIIVEMTKRFNEIKINTKIEKYEECLDNNEVVERAKEALRTQTINGEEIEKLVNLNSKHFANYCKTGQLAI